MAHAKQECDQSETIESIKKKVDHIDQTLYFGNGKPPLTTQIEVMAVKMDTVAKKLETIEGIGKAIILAVLSLFCATLWNMVQKYHADSVNSSNNNHTAKTEVYQYDY
jgi:hypothetical protein